MNDIVKEKNGNHFQNDKKANKGIGLKKLQGNKLW